MRNAYIILFDSFPTKCRMIWGVLMTECVVCGSEIADNENYCRECGASRLEARSSQTEVAQAEKIRSRRWLLGCSCALFVVVVFVAVGVFVSLGVFAIYSIYNLETLELGPVSMELPSDVQVTYTPVVGSEILKITESPSEPVMTIIPEEPSTQTYSQVEFHGITFSYDPSLAGVVWKFTMPELKEPLLDASPEYIEFTFDGYIFSDSFYFPIIRVYPVDEYAAINSIAADIITEQRKFLDQKPSIVQDEIPVLPFWNAAQAIRVQIKYIDFRNGEGVRFLTQYGQDIWPINNEDIFYTYQGLTDDGRYYISAILPVSHPNLPKDGNEYPGGDYLTFEDMYESYIADIENQLDSAPASSFYPDLSLLDKMIESLQVLSEE